MRFFPLLPSSAIALALIFAPAFATCGDQHAQTFDQGGFGMQPARANSPSIRLT
jgi:hypothetical protein